MSMGQPDTELALSEDDCSQLTLIAHSQTISASLVTRARIVLAVLPVRPTAILLSVCNTRVPRWASDVFGSWSVASTGCMTKFGPASLARSTMNVWLI